MKMKTKNEEKSDYIFTNKWVLSCLLKVATFADVLMVIGNLFQYLGPNELNEPSAIFNCITGTSRRRVSLASYPPIITPNQKLTPPLSVFVNFVTVRSRRAATMARKWGIRQRLYVPRNVIIFIPRPLCQTPMLYRTIISVLWWFPQCQPRGI